MFERLKSLLGINKKDKIVIKHRPIVKSTNNNGISPSRKYRNEDDDMINQTSNTVVVNTMIHNLLYDANTPSKTLIDDSFENAKSNISENKINDESYTPTSTTLISDNSEECSNKSIGIEIDTGSSCDDNNGSISYESTSFGD